jgi:hypothetical protein
VSLQALHGQLLGALAKGASGGEGGALAVLTVSMVVEGHEAVAKESALGALVLIAVD